MADNLIACRPGSYGKFRDAAFAHMAQIGLRCVETDVPPDGQWAARKAEYEQHGLTATSVTGGIKLSEAQQVADFERTAKAAEYFGARIIFLSVNSGGKPLAECYELLSKLGDVARKHNATIGLETHPDLVTNGATAAATMQAVNHPHVRLNFDTANIYYYNDGADAVAELKKFLPWLISMHLKETNGKPKAWYFPGLHEGQGIVDFPEILRLCNAAGFHGPFTLEIEGCEGETLTREQALQRVANSMQYLRAINAIP